MAAPRPSESPANVGGVYCYREPISGLWAYYSVDDDGRILHQPRPAEFGEEAAFVIAGLADELDELRRANTPRPLEKPKHFLRLI